MLEFIAQNIGTIVVAFILACIVAMLIISLVKDKKKGKSSCGGGCSGCTMSGMCHKIAPKADANNTSNKPC